MIVVLAALAGAVVGALLPRLIAMIPDRETAGGFEPAEPAEEDAPPVDGASDPGAPGGFRAGYEDAVAAHDAGRGQQPVAYVPTPYRSLAAAPHLAWYLGAATAALWALLAAGGPDAALPAVLFVAGLGVAMAYIDVREHRLPDWLTYPALAGAAVGLGGAALATSELSSYGRAWIASAVLITAFLVLALIRPGELGFGDVKLAASLGMLLGWIGWGHLVLGTFLSFAFGGAYSAVLLVLGRAGRRTAIPFGPFLLAGTFTAIGWGEALLEAYLN